MQQNAVKQCGSPATATGKSSKCGAAKSTRDVDPVKRIAVEPELVITVSERDEWYRRNPHARPGVLEDLQARGILVIVPDNLAVGASPTRSVQGVRV